MNKNENRGIMNPKGLHPIRFIMFKTVADESHHLAESSVGNELFWGHVHVPHDPFFAVVCTNLDGDTGTVFVANLEGLIGYIEAQTEELWIQSIMYVSPGSHDGSTLWGMEQLTKLTEVVMLSGATSYLLDVDGLVGCSAGVAEGRIARYKVMYHVGLEDLQTAWSLVGPGTLIS
jgi:hypothetical protein